VLRGDGGRRQRSGKEADQNPLISHNQNLLTNVLTRKAEVA
jgi:hypothetical protein